MQVLIEPIILVGMSNDKDPTRLQGIDAHAHRAFRSFTAMRGLDVTILSSKVLTGH
jgi:hypothetical protein